MGTAGIGAVVGSAAQPLEARATTAESQQEVPTTEGRLIGYCHTCEVRECCMEKGLANCSVCEDKPL